MRRDLTRGCAACRLRFSSRLSHCPICHAEGTHFAEATTRVQPTSRAAWLAKWVITISVIPAVGGVLVASSSLLYEGWPPKNALDVILYVLGTIGIALGASIAVALPLGLWFGLIAAVRFVLKHLIDRPRRTLRITIETIPRRETTLGRHPMHRLWDKLETFVDERIERGPRYLVFSWVGFVILQIVAEIFGSEPVVKTTGIREFAESAFLVLGFLNLLAAVVIGIFISSLAAIIKKGHDFLKEPPNLFGYHPSPPPVDNEATLETYSKGREEIVGTAMPLDESECAAVGMELEHRHLISPVSQLKCLAFRLTGHADIQPVDDADARNFVVVTKDQKRCIVSTDDVVMAWKSKPSQTLNGFPIFLQQRGFPGKFKTFGPYAIHQSVLCEGDLVRVVGRRTEIRIGAAGYRGDEIRTMLDAGDGLPVVIRQAEEKPS